jgi:pimeloyl-[acyl-carrier protein] methyl ester esterase
MKWLHVERSETAQRDPGGAPLVMLHGWGMNLRVFDDLRKDLRDSAAEPPQQPETWAIDLPGYGRSPWWPEAAAFEVQCEAVLAALPPRCVLAGWSFGAKIAMALAAHHPLRIDSLVLLSATPKFARAADWPHGTVASTLEVFRAMLQRDWRQTLEDFVWLQVRGSHDAEQTRARLEAALIAQGMPHQEALLAGLQLLESLDLREVVARIRQPVLVIGGLNDRVALPGATRWLAQTLPQATLVEIPRAGHAPFISHHTEVAAAIRGFLA